MNEMQIITEVISGDMRKRHLGELLLPFTGSIYVADMSFLWQLIRGGHAVRTEYNQPGFYPIAVSQAVAKRPDQGTYIHTLHIPTTWYQPEYQIYHMLNIRIEDDTVPAVQGDQLQAFLGDAVAVGKALRVVNGISTPIVDLGINNYMVPMGMITAVSELPTRNPVTSKS